MLAADVQPIFDLAPRVELGISVGSSQLDRLSLATLLHRSLRGGINNRRYRG